MFGVLCCSQLVPCKQKEMKTTHTKNIYSSFQTMAWTLPREETSSLERSGESSQWLRFRYQESTISPSTSAYSKHLLSYWQTSYLNSFKLVFSASEQIHVYFIHSCKQSNPAHAPSHPLTPTPTHKISVLAVTWVASIITYRAPTHNFKHANNTYWCNCTIKPNSC